MCVCVGGDAAARVRVRPIEAREKASTSNYNKRIHVCIP